MAVQGENVLIFNDGFLFFLLRDLTSVNLTSFNDVNEASHQASASLVVVLFVGVLACRWRENSILMSDHKLPSETRYRRRLWDVATTAASLFVGSLGTK